MSHVTVLYGLACDMSHCLFIDGRKRGFAFATFTQREEAESAVSELTEISGRRVAVDWAVAKDKYEQLKANESEAW